MRSNLFLSATVLFLFACLAHASYYSHYMTHPLMIKPAYLQCQRHHPTSSECAEIARAASDFTRLYHMIMINGQGFGEKILRMQIQLAGLQQGLWEVHSNIEQERSQFEIRQLETKLAYYKAVVRVLSES